MALPALHLLPQFVTVFDALRSDRRLDRNLDRFAGLFALPARGKRLDVGDQVSASLGRQRIPVRHVGIREPTRDRVKQILVSWQSARRCRAALERRGYKIARLGIDPRGIVAVAIAERSMAAHAVTAISF